MSQQRKVVTGIGAFLDFVEKFVAFSDQCGLSIEEAGLIEAVFSPGTFAVSSSEENSIVQLLRDKLDGAMRFAKFCQTAYAPTARVFLRDAFRKDMSFIFALPDKEIVRRMELKGIKTTVKAIERLRDRMAREERHTFARASDADSRTITKDLWRLGFALSPEGIKTGGLKASPSQRRVWLDGRNGTAAQKPGRLSRPPSGKIPRSARRNSRRLA
jgi:hypothetical protein